MKSLKMRQNLYKELIQKEIDALKREKSNSIKKNNILEIIENIGAIFTGAYLHHGELFKETKKYCIQNKIKKAKIRYN